jgi:hypothetical protein
MRLLLAASVTAALLAAGCSKKASYENACKHMLNLATDELEKEIEKINKLDKDGSMKKMADGLRDKAKSSTVTDLETCKAKMEEKGVDASCVLDAKTLAQATLCAVKAKK